VFIAELFQGEPFDHHLHLGAGGQRKCAVYLTLPAPVVQKHVIEADLYQVLVALIERRGLAHHNLVGMPGRQCLQYPLPVLFQLNPAHQYMSHLTFRSYVLTANHRPSLSKALSKLLGYRFLSKAEIAAIMDVDAGTPF
jgi:hypothetical protein